MDCLYQHVHPTVYMCIKGDIYDRRAAPRFSYTDRSEVCWCGHTHERQHFAAWVAGNEVYAHCFSAKASADRRTIRVDPTSATWRMTLRRRLRQVTKRSG